MVFDLEVKYQARKRDMNGLHQDDGDATSAKIGDIYVPDLDTVARIGNVLADSFSKQSRKNGYSNLAVSILIFKNGKKIVEAWPASTQFFNEEGK